MKNIFKSIFGRKGSRIWFIVTSAVLVLLLVVNVVANTVLYEVLASVLGGKRAAFASGGELIYESDYDSKKETLKKANEFNEIIAEQGVVLLKNDNGALPVYTPETKGENKASVKPKVSVFGKNSVNIAYGGSGSGASGNSSAKTLYDSLHAAGYDTNDELEKFYKSNASGKKRPAKPEGSNLDDGKSVTIPTYETPLSDYTETVKNSYNNYADAAIVVFTRMGGEGFDLPRTMEEDENSHYLELDKNEKDLLTAVCNGNFKHIIVLLNIGTTMEAGFLNDPAYSKIDAALWMGFPGESGTMAIGRILNGNVNPSGRTVDTWAADFTKNPTWNNFGESKPGYDEFTVGGEGQEYYFVDYEESIYIGYKYYETRAFDERETNPDWYDENVIYPFGYGLSYTTFEWTVDAASIENLTIDGKTKYEVKVTVKNTGDTAGMDVVELYGHAPYYYYGIEKPYVTLLDFAKTPVLYPETQASADKPNSTTVTLTFDPYYLASYDYYDVNGNGFAGYELDPVKAGADSEYCLFVSKNSHTAAETIPFNVPATGIQYPRDPITNYRVENRYSDNEDARLNSDYHITASGSQYLTRGDWTGTMPQPAVSESKDEREVSDQLISFLKSTPDTNFKRESVTKSASLDKSLIVTYRDMLYNKGVYGFGDDVADEDKWQAFTSYDDGRWEYLIDATNAEELLNMINYGAFKTNALSSIGKPLTNDTDGPAGFVNFMLNDGTYHDTCYYASQMLIASTWSEELATDFGEMVGNEGIWGADGKGNGMPYSGWYAPGANIHRSPFGGRNFEYCSEDSILTGKMAAAQVRGCQSKGLYCFIKHFAVNDQETHRSINGVSVWLTEQTLREDYLRAFEIIVKEGGTRAIMSSFNRIGGVWAGGDYRLLTEILRNEWGFKGSVITDFTSGMYMDARQMAYAGGDINLNNQEKYGWNDFDASNPDDVVVLRRATKNILYTVLNSNVMNREIIGYKMPLWQELLIVADCLIVVGLGVWGAFAVKKSLTKEDFITLKKAEFSANEQ